jgi:hypothetical protein
MFSSTRSALRRALLPSMMFLLPLGLVASDCNELYDTLAAECESAIDPILCMHNAHIAYCNCMGLQCT